MLCDPPSIAPEAGGAFALTFAVMTDSRGEWEVGPEARQPPGGSAPMAALCRGGRDSLLAYRVTPQVSVPTPPILGLLHLDSPAVPGALPRSRLHIFAGLCSRPQTFLSPCPVRPPSEPSTVPLPTSGFSDHPRRRRPLFGAIVNAVLFQCFNGPRAAALMCHHIPRKSVEERAWPLRGAGKPVWDREGLGQGRGHV